MRVFHSSFAYIQQQYALLTHKTRVLQAVRRVEGYPVLMRRRNRAATRSIARRWHTSMQCRKTYHMHQHKVSARSSSRVCIVYMPFTTHQDEPKPEDVVQGLNANPDQHVWDLLEDAKSRRIRTPVSIPRCVADCTYHMDVCFHFHVHCF